MAQRRTNPVLITSAAQDPEVELRRREIRYVAMMLLRAACLIGAAVVVAGKPPLWGLWASLLVVGAVVLPWLAVVLANDAPPKKRSRGAAAVPGTAGPAAITGYEPKVIEHDE